MTITPESAKREISDLQRLLLSLGLMKFTNTTQSGTWGDETRDAVAALYEQIGWDHDADEQYITAPAMAAATGLQACQHATAEVARGGGSHAGGGGSHAGGGGSHAGGGGSHAGGGGSHAGGGGSHAGGGGSHAGGGGSHAGGGGSHAGGGGSHAG